MSDERATAQPIEGSYNVETGRSCPSCNMFVPSGAVHFCHNRFVTADDRYDEGIREGLQIASEIARLYWHTAETFPSSAAKTIVQMVSDAIAERIESSAKSRRAAKGQSQ